MRKDLIPEMIEFNAMSKPEQIETLCAVHECSEKIRKIHRDQYVNRRWNPHPPERFVNWWKELGWLQTEKKSERGWSISDEPIDAARAFNCEAVREVYKEAKEIGAA